jgi:hypothetical protein
MITEWIEIDGVLCREVKYGREPPKTIGRHLSGKNIKDQIINYAKNNPDASPKEIAALLGCSNHYVSQTIYDFRNGR